MYRMAAIFLLVLGVCSQGASARPHEVKMGQALRQSLDLFFSNFSEARVPPFERGRITDRQLLEFGVLHRILDEKGLEPLSPRHAQFGGGGWRLAGERVSGAAAYYFGRVPTKYASVLGVAFKNGYFYGRYADGETYDVARVTRLLALGGGFFRADVDIVTPDSPNADLDKPWEETGAVSRRMRATIREVGSGKSRRFVLIDYAVRKGRP